MNAHKASLFALALGAVVCNSAQAIIDPFTLSQGPYMVGPGEELTPDQAGIIAISALGGFRVVAAEMGEDAPADSTATVAIGGGWANCTIEVSVVDPVNSKGGCGVAWDRGDGTAFDFSMIESFDLPVIDVQGSATLSLLVVDVHQGQAVAPVENVQQGMLQLSPESFQSTLGNIDWTVIDALTLSVINNDGADASVTLGVFGVSGVLPGAPDAPTRLSDQALSDTVSGNWFNPIRTGEGCQLTREADAETFILTCYVYREGGQLWMIGTGQLVDGQIVSDDMVITRGARYGAAFDPDDVERIPFGTVAMNFTDCNTGSVAMSPIVDGFGPVLLPMQRIVEVACDEGVPAPDLAVRNGNWYDPARSGEGFQLVSEGRDGTYALTYYTYLDGEPAWLIGTARFAGGDLVFSDTVITSGTGFGPDFDPLDVVRTPFGIMFLEFEDCNNASIRLVSTLPEFGDQTRDVTRIVQGACP
jgi:hypothetical protein